MQIRGHEGTLSLCPPWQDMIDLDTEIGFTFNDCEFFPNGCDLLSHAFTVQRIGFDLKDRF